MERIFTKMTTTISEFKKNPAAATSQAKGQPFAVLKNNKTLFYVVTPERYEELLEIEWERNIAPTVLDRANSDKFVTVDLDDI